MNKLSDIITISREEDINVIIIDTTHSCLMSSSDVNPGLIKEARDWVTYKPFVEKYGWLFSYQQEDLVSIFVLSQLLRNFKLICHPIEQDLNSSLNMLNLRTSMVNWILKTCIWNRKEEGFIVEFEEFRKSGYLPGFRWVELEKAKVGNWISRAIHTVKFFYRQMKRYEPESKIYFLNSSSHVNQAVICGGIADVWRSHNYMGYQDESQVDNLLKILKGSSQPRLSQVLDIVDFYAIDFMGHDLGYARHLKIYSKSDMSQIVEDLIGNFDSFIKEYRRIYKECDNLKDFGDQLQELITRYGR